MAKWTVYNTNKKCVAEETLYLKGDDEIIVTTWWRFGSWTVETKTDEPPMFGTDAVMTNTTDDNIIDIEMNEMYDGWIEYTFPEWMSDEEKERMETSYNDEFDSQWVEEGWIESDYEVTVYDGVTVEKIDE